MLEVFERWMEENMATTKAGSIEISNEMYAAGGLYDEDLMELKLLARSSMGILYTLDFKSNVSIC
jgi:hypothetical protein